MSKKKASLAGGLDDYYARLAAVASKPRLLRSRAKVGSGYPRLSSSMGVHRTQVGEAKALDAARGVPTDYTPDGRPEFRTRGHQKAWCRAHGVTNQDGGYGD